MGTADPEYFDPLMARRQALFWVVATRRQLDRWEPLVAEFIRHLFSKEKPPGQLVWEAEAERHLALVAARNLVRAVNSLPSPAATLSPDLATALTNVRDLAEHWDENMPVFNVRTWRGRERLTEPRFPSGKKFAAAHPEESPYSQSDWNGKDGPLLAPELPAAMLRHALDDVQRQVLEADPDLARFVPEAVPTPWLGEEAGEDRWWPRPT